MDIETFLQLKPTWAYEPCLYIVKQMFPGNNAYRCGAAGTQLFKTADPVYGSDKSGTFTGLLCSVARRRRPKRQSPMTRLSWRTITLP